MRAESLNNQKMPHNCCVPFCNTTSKKNKNLRFHRFAKRKEQKELWISKIRRHEGEYFTVTSNTRVCSRHFREDGYTISEDGKGKRTVLRKGAVPSLFQCTATKRSRSTLASKGKRKGGTLEVPLKKRRRKNCQRCERKRAVIDKLETDLQNKNAQLKDLTENVEHLEKEKQDREQEVASSSMGDKHVCFSPENFRNQDKLIRF